MDRNANAYQVLITAASGRDDVGLSQSCHQGTGHLVSTYLVLQNLTLHLATTEANITAVGSQSGSTATSAGRSCPSRRWNEDFILALYANGKCGVGIITKPRNWRGKPPQVMDSSKVSSCRVTRCHCHSGFSPESHSVPKQGHSFLFTRARISPDLFKCALIQLHVQGEEG